MPIHDYEMEIPSKKKCISQSLSILEIDIKLVIDHTDKKSKNVWIEAGAKKVNNREKRVIKTWFE